MSDDALGPGREIVTGEARPAAQEYLAALRADIEALAREQRHMPTLGQVHALLRRHGVDGDQLEALLGAAPAATSRTGRRPRHGEHPAPDPGLPPASVAAREPRPPALPSHPASPTLPTSRAEPSAGDDDPRATATDADDHDGEDEDDWNDADPFAVDAPKFSPLTSAKGRLVTRVASDLRDDYERSGSLTLVDVTTLAHRRGLSSEAVEDVLVALAEAGVEVSEERAQEAYDGAGDLDGGQVRRRVGALERDQLRAYFASAGKIHLLDAEQEVRLGRAIRAGQQALETLEADALEVSAPAGRWGSAVEPSAYGQVITAGRQAHRDLVSANLRLVVSIAKLPRYYNSGVELADRIQDGNTGLMRAADKYDPELGYKFSTYATWWIRQSIERGVGDRGRMIRLPIYMHDRVRKVRALKRRLEYDLGRPVTLKEIAEQVDMDAGAVAAALTWSEPVVSYDALVNTEDGTPLLDFLVSEGDEGVATDPAQVVLDRQRASDLADVLALVLTPREIEVLTQRFGLDGHEVATLDDIGEQLGLTRERIRQVQMKALEFLREDHRVDGLYEYLVDGARSDNLRTPLGERAISDTGGPAKTKRRKKRATT